MTTRKSRLTKVSDYFQPKRQRRTPKPTTIPNAADQLAERLGCRPIYLTTNRESWILHAKQWLPSTNADTFATEWNQHPTKRHELRLFGKVVHEKRWSQMWGLSYSYSGTTNTARPMEEAGAVVHELLTKVNELSRGIPPHDDQEEKHPYNAVLQNWYQPEDTIGLHADDERGHVEGSPIWSLSWGGTRRFILCDKNDSSKKTEVYLESGDLLVMGGRCQQTHKHMVPAVRKTKDPPTSDRINWTVRAFSVVR